MKPSKRQDAAKDAPKEEFRSDEGGDGQAQRERLEKERRILSPETENAEGADRRDHEDMDTRR